MKLAQVVLTALALPGFVILPAVGLDYMGYEGAIPTPCLRECPHYYLAEVLRENPDNPKPSTPATPIAPNFIITAGHRANLLAPDPGFPYRRVLIDGELYYMVDRRPPHKVNDYYDLSIYRIEKLNGEPANLTHWVALYDHDDEIGKEITIPSFGYQGYVGAPEQGLHWGKNVLRTASTILAFGRDEIGEKDYITYEAFGISQDSGSAWLIKDGPEWKISGYFTSGSGGPRLSIHHQWIDNAIAEMGGTRPAPTITCDTTWQETTGDWMNPANWNPSLPTATDLVKIDSNPTAIISNGSAEANEIVVGMDSSADISQTGGTANVGEGIYIGTHTGSIGTYTMTGGILNIGRTDFKGRLIVGLHGTGTLTVDSTDAQINVDELIVGSDGTGTLNTNDPG
ncbi:MAG: hypothetical protein JSV03_11645, partial [Planctomycetota bacterium]